MKRFNDSLINSYIYPTEAYFDIYTIMFSKL